MNVIRLFMYIIWFEGTLFASVAKIPQSPVTERTHQNVQEARTYYHDAPRSYQCAQSHLASGRFQPRNSYVSHTIGCALNIGL